LSLFAINIKDSRINPADTAFLSLYAKRMRSAVYDLITTMGECIYLTQHVSTGKLPVHNHWLCAADLNAMAKNDSLPELSSYGTMSLYRGLTHPLSSPYEFSGKLSDKVVEWISSDRAGNDVPDTPIFKNGEVGSSLRRAIRIFRQDPNAFLHLSSSIVKKMCEKSPEECLLFDSGMVTSATLEEVFDPAITLTILQNIQTTDIFQTSKQRLAWYTSLPDHLIGKFNMVWPAARAARNELLLPDGLVLTRFHLGKDNPDFLTDISPTLRKEWDGVLLVAARNLENIFPDAAHQIDDIGLTFYSEEMSKGRSRAHDSHIQISGKDWGNNPANQWRLVKHETTHIIQERTEDQYPLGEVDQWFDEFLAMVATGEIRGVSNIDIWANKLLGKPKYRIDWKELSTETNSNRKRLFPHPSDMNINSPADRIAQLFGENNPAMIENVRKALAATETNRPTDKSVQILRPDPEYAVRGNYFVACLFYYALVKRGGEKAVDDLISSLFVGHSSYDNALSLTLTHHFEANVEDFNQIIDDTLHAIEDLVGDEEVKFVEDHPGIKDLAEKLLGMTETSDRFARMSGGEIHAALSHTMSQYPETLDQIDEYLNKFSESPATVPLRLAKIVNYLKGGFSPPHIDLKNEIDELERVAKKHLLDEAMLKDKINVMRAISNYVNGDFSSVAKYLRRIELPETFFTSHYNQAVGSLADRAMDPHDPHFEEDVIDFFLNFS
jgi:hypothetical protein